jgi:trk system potassium uptake protein TrkA
MERRILNQFAVIGLGRFGSTLVKALTEAGKEVLAIDFDQERAEEMEGIATHTVTADATDEKVLKTLKIDEMDAVIVCIGDLQASILTVLTCKEMGVKHIVAKAKNAKHEKVLQKMGADYVLIPEAAMAYKLAGRLVNRRLNDLMEVNESYSIMEVDVPVAWAGKTLIELDIRKHHKVNIILVLSGGKEVISSPHGATMLSENDRIIVGGNNDDIARFVSKLSNMK